MMHRHVIKMLNLGLMLALAATLLLPGCGAWKSVKKWAGYGTGEDVEEPKAPPEAIQETVVIDGKTWVRSKNPYYLTYPDQPEYIYVEKGKEFVGLQANLIQALAKKLGLETAARAKGVPEDKVQEMVRKEVDRILREQGIGALYTREKGGPAVTGRYVAVVPNPETSPGMAAPARMLAADLGDALSRQKDLKVTGPEQVKAALAAAKVTGSLKQPQNIKALGDALGIQGLIFAGVVPPERGASGFMVLEVYDTFMGNKVEGIASPVEGTPGTEAIKKFVRDNALRVSAALINSVDWFGRVEFTKEGRVYLSLGQNAGLKVGDRLKVVTPGKEVINPTTRASLGFTADETQGELKVTELLGTTGAVAQVISGGPFKANDKVKAAR